MARGGNEKCHRRVAFLISFGTRAISRVLSIVAAISATRTIIYLG